MSRISTDSDFRDGQVAAPDASDGRGPDGPCVESERSVAVPRSTVATAADGLRNGAIRIVELRGLVCSDASQESWMGA